MTRSRILLTGAAGQLGHILREALASECEILRVSDIAPMGSAKPGEEVVQCDLADATAVLDLCQEVDAIVHLGGLSTENSWPKLLQANIIGLINVYEAARLAGVERVIYASSNHVTGMYPVGGTLSHLSGPRPDSRYGATKVFGENIAALYAYKHGIRSLCLRIGSCSPRPENRRGLSTWLSYGDLVQLMRVGLNADYSFEIAYGVSNNTRSWWDNSAARGLGYDPQDNAEIYAAELDNIPFENELADSFQGGNSVGREFTGRKEWLTSD